MNGREETILIPAREAPVEPVVSVVIATYNVAKFVAESIRSALGQSFAAFEIIVADDGSTDGTLDIVCGFDDPRITILSRPHRGPTWVLNDCLDRARGRYISLLDGDDIWSPDRLRRHVEYMDGHPESDLTFSLSRIIEEDGKDTGFTTRSCTGALSFERLFADNLVANGSAVMIRHQAVLIAGQFDTGMEAGYDHELWLRLALLREGNIFCIPEVLTSYRRRAGQMTRDWRMMERSSHRLAEKFRPIRPIETARAEKQRLRNLYRYLAMVAYQNREHRVGVKVLWRSARASPAGFLATSRSYQTCLALAAGLLLPDSSVGHLQRFASGIAGRLRGRGQSQA